MASETFVVTGATGNIGAELTRKLLAAGKSVRALARNEEKLAALGQGVEARTGSLDDRAFLIDAFRGATAVFAMIPPNYATSDPRVEQRRQAEAIAAAVRESKVKRVVALSSVGAELPDRTGPIAGLNVFEELLDRIPGVKVVHLRAAYFMENHLGSIGLIKSAGINAGMLHADLPIAMVATRDIAAVAFEELTTPRTEGRAVRYVLGPRDYTMSEATRILGAALGKPDVKYVESSEGDFKAALLGHGFSEKLADLFVEMLRAFNTGLIRVEQRSAKNTTPTTLEEFVKGAF